MNGSEAQLGEEYYIYDIDSGTEEYLLSEEYGGTSIESGWTRMENLTLVKEEYGQPIELPKFVKYKSKGMIIRETFTQVPKGTFNGQ